MPFKILLADDDESLRRVIEFRLRQDGYEVQAVPDGARAWEMLSRRRYDLLLSDMRMPGLDGLELLTRALQLDPEIKVILITAYATVQQAVEAVKSGAFDYITKPFEQEELSVIIQKALAFKRLEAENQELKSRLDGVDYFRSIIGTSAAIKDVLNLIDKVAPTDATVLLTGESGTGKELVARAIHKKSLRNAREFVPVNCAAVPKELVESELFGHVKGAFTGAVRDKKGKFQIADGGTLFLDEISELGLELQAKILRALQERVVEPVGSEKSVSVDVRIVAATNSDLRQKVSGGSFRDDLFYRLNVIPVLIPPLRERKEDIPLFLKFFSEKFAPGQNIEFSQELLQKLTAHDWPGNVRELENLVERMAVLRRSSKLGVSDLSPDFGRIRGASLPEEAQMSLRQSEKELILKALEKSRGNKSKAARILGVPRHVLLYRMKTHKIQTR
ncbi:MAG: sigma-54-dependent Fis family transcriptional regulator [Candidatus Eiseniibacteriota bacterium]|nr:MAG: sigma-54-dependent Fis family transcriptional regulator [Candidatus Eisenbacteria bacterium]